MHETFIIALVKKHLWEFVMSAVCLSMIHQGLENWGGSSRWVKIAKGIVNAVYASAFFGGLGGYLFSEVGLVGGILLGGLVGLSTAKELAIMILTRYSKDSEHKV